MRLRHVALALALILSACGGAPKRPEGPPPTAIAAGDVGPRLQGLRDNLHAIRAFDDRLEAQVRDEQVIVTLAAQDLFEGGNGQLSLAALQPLAEVAAAIAAWGATVTHVVAFGRDGTIVDLAERRALSVAENLAVRALPRARVRAESRIDEDRASEILLVLRPVVLGREARAWRPPEP
jgi:outer membrane protein OmpA-like peptidoglycan-associated protein